MLDFLMQYAHIVEITGWVMLGYSALCWIVLYKESAKRNTTSNLRWIFTMTAILCCYIGLTENSITFVNIYMPWFYVFAFMSPFRYIVPFRHKIWNVCCKVLQIVFTLPMLVLVIYKDITCFTSWWLLLDIALAVLSVLVVGILNGVLTEDCPCPNCHRYTEQDDRKDREARGEIWDQKGDIVKCPYCGQIYNTKTNEAYELQDNK